MKQFLLICATIFGFAKARAQSCPVLVINEVSNGLSGSREFFEFVVVGCPGGSQDIRNWIIDDQSGRCISCASGQGISNGHFRFSGSSVWANVRVGSIIVVYNAEDRNPPNPADDPTDANNDYVYIVPHNNPTYIVQHQSFPNLSACNTFTTGGGATGWTFIMGLRNDGDLLQVVDPNNTGVAAHGISYGSPTISCPNILHLSAAAGTGTTYQFRNTINDNPWQSNNWSVLSATSDSPGSPNNPANQNWINKMRFSPSSIDFVWQGTAADGNWNNCRNWDVLNPPCGTNPNVRIGNAGAAFNLDLATVPSISLGNLSVDVAGAVPLPGTTGCLSNTVTVNGTLTLNRGVIQTCSPIATTTAVYVANSSPGAILGASNVSFINGRLRRAIQPSATSVDYLYPLGRGSTSSDYVPAEVRFSNTATLTELMGYYNTSTDPATSTTGNNCGANPPFAVLMTGFWRFESVPAAATPTYTLRVRPGVTYTPDRTFLVKRPNGSSPWVAEGCCVPPYNPSYIDRGCLTGFSDFKAQTTTTPLPVEGWTFEVRKISRGAQLFWQTTRESGVERYEV
ncbi:MAG: hypothetical protein NZ534_06660, partial [Bacteroidia bacterium]|nr:hypothetical protein [Bacteroidia bacterium]